MAKETYSHEGNEIIQTTIIKKHEANVYGCFGKDTKIGKYDFYDVYITIDGVQHCMNEGDPFYKKPTKSELTDLVDSFLDEV
ncbi:MAG TPA: hypothetical protein PJ987_09480 [Bacteroidia bacterium]|nr:hypothetical protein [Bacteroidia bacterium]HMY42191.1 hypothetical protein [Chitinophagales bacterium]